MFGITSIRSCYHHINTMIDIHVIEFYTYCLCLLGNSVLNYFNLSGGHEHRRQNTYERLG